MVEEIIGRLPELTGAQLSRLEDELRRRASSAGGGEDALTIQDTAPPVTEVLEYRPHEDGYLQLELRRYIRRDGSARERGPYWYFQYHEGGKRKVTTHLRLPAVEVAAWVGLLLTCGYDGARGAGSAESRGAAGAVGPAG